MLYPRKWLPFGACQLRPASARKRGSNLHYPVLRHFWEAMDGKAPSYGVSGIDFRDAQSKRAAGLCFQAASSHAVPVEYQ